MVVARYPLQLDRLIELTSDSPTQVEHWRNIRTELDRIRATITDPGVKLRARVLAGEAVPADVTAFNAANPIPGVFSGARAEMAVAIGTERQLLRQRTEAADKANQLLATILVGDAIATGVSG